MTHEGDEGAHFAVWAPNASRVTVMGDFNDWNPSTHELFSRPDGSGIWEGFVPGIKPGIGYKYHIESSVDGYMADKTDPFGVRTEVPPNTASILWELSYDWLDHDWMADREGKNGLDSPMSIYEMHLGSWRRAPGENGGTFLTYKDIAGFLVEHMKRTGFTHVEFLPVMEHPFYGSWGYQVTSYFAPTARYGPPEELMYLIDPASPKRHRSHPGLGALPLPHRRRRTDLLRRDAPVRTCRPAPGTPTRLGQRHFQLRTPRSTFFPDFQRHVLAGSLSRRRPCGWTPWPPCSTWTIPEKKTSGYPNRYGSNENLDAIEFIRSMNVSLYQDFPHTQTMAEESTAWPMVSKPTYLGGLGFGMKWDMGWMHDTLAYISQDPIHRKYHHNQLTFSIMYTFSENFVLPLSHDEVVHGKGALIGKMPGDEWKRFANLRLLYGYMWSHPGKKLLFMGGEFGQTNEWYHETSLDWHLLEHDPHRGMLRWMEDLNRFYAATPPLYENDFHPDGFRWIDCNDSDSSVISFSSNRKGPERYDPRGVELYPPTARQLSDRSSRSGVLEGSTQQRRRRILRDPAGVTSAAWKPHPYPAMGTTIPFH